MRGLRILSLSWLAPLVAGLAVPGRLTAQGPGQGITVHGHWVIEVRNSDGTLKARREFENALQPAGKTTLVNLFMGASPMGQWAILLDGSPAPCPLRPIAPSGCQLAEPGSGSHPTSQNLTKTANSATFEFVLQGSFVATSDGLVSAVSTQVGGTFGAFTTAVLATPITVQATQTVSVTVTFTFS